MEKCEIRKREGSNDARARGTEGLLAVCSIGNQSHGPAIAERLISRACTVPSPAPNAVLASFKRAAGFVLEEVIVTGGRNRVSTALNWRRVCRTSH